MSDTGKVANDVEIEQIVEDEEAAEDDAFASFVQVRLCVFVRDVYVLFPSKPLSLSLPAHPAHLPFPFFPLPTSPERHPTIP